MTAWIRGAVRDFWAGGGGGAAALLAPPEAVFRLVAAARNRWHDRRPPPGTEVPVISVGSLTAGGAGKTPVVRWIAEWLARRGAAPAIVTRGYGADEVALHRRWFGADAVFAGRDRRALVRAAAERGRTVAVVDDGFQHRRLGRALDLAVVAADDPLPARLHPRGPYREPLASLGRASHVVLASRAPGDRAGRWRERLAEVAPQAPVTRVTLALNGWMALDGAPARPPRGDVLAVCSIARPGAFGAALRSALPGVDIEVAAWADHHDYRSRDVARIRARLAGRALVCTEKDAVKLAAFPEFAPSCVAAGFGVRDRLGGALAGALARAAGVAAGGAPVAERGRKVRAR